MLIRLELSKWNEETIVEVGETEIDIIETDVDEVLDWFDKDCNRNPEDILDDAMEDIVNGALNNYPNLPDFDFWDYCIDGNLDDFRKWAVNFIKERQTERRLDYYKEYPRDDGMEYTHDDETYVYYRIKKSDMQTEQERRNRLGQFVGNSDPKPNLLQPADGKQTAVP